MVVASEVLDQLRKKFAGEQLTLRAVAEINRKLSGDRITRNWLTRRMKTIEKAAAK
jgi:hypothetical protein